jgi:GntR family transcriptional regulator
VRTRGESETRRIGSDRYRRELTQIASGRSPRRRSLADQNSDWCDYHLDRWFREVGADTAGAELFWRRTGTMLLERQFVFYGEIMGRNPTGNNLALLAE